MTPKAVEETVSINSPVHTSEIMLSHMLVREGSTTRMTLVDLYSAAVAAAAAPAAAAMRVIVHVAVAVEPALVALLLRLLCG